MEICNDSQESTRVGGTVGGIYATASIGSIVGTFLSGFVLIPILGLKTIIFFIGTIVALLSFIVKGRRVVTLVWLCIIAALFFLFFSRAEGMARGRQETFGTVLIGFSE